MAKTTAGPRGPYAKSARVREGILEAAAVAFAEAGFRGATMKDVAERAGISQRGLVHHFETKDELLLEVLNYRDEKTREILTNAESAGQVAGLLLVVHDNARFPRLIELQTLIAAEATSPDHPAHEHFADRYLNYRTYVAQKFEAIREAGELDSPLSPVVLAEVFIGLVDGLQIQWLYDTSIDVEGAALSFLSMVCPAVIAREASRIPFDQVSPPEAH